jgi:hypothetical protein
VYHITGMIERTFANKGLFSAVFRDVAQAFDRGWHRGLVHKLRSILPDHFYQVLKSYLTNRHFRVKHEGSYSELKLIKAGVPQGSVLGPVLYLLYINGVPTTLNNTMTTFADDTSHGSRRDYWTLNQKATISCKQFRYLDKKKWRTNSTNQIGTNKIRQKPIFVNGTLVPCQYREVSEV